MQHSAYYIVHFDRRKATFLLPHCLCAPKFFGIPYILNAAEITHTVTLVMK